VPIRRDVPEDVGILAAHAEAELKRANIAASVAPAFDDFAWWWFENRYEKGELGRAPARARTLQRVRDHVKYFVKAFGDERMDRITHDDVKDALNDLHLEASTKNKYLKYVRAIFADACRFGRDEWKLKDNPAARVALRRENAPAEKDQTLFHECILLLDWMLANRPKTAHAHAAFALCGLRLNEVQKMGCDRVKLGPEYAPAAGVFVFDDIHRKDGKPIAVPIPTVALKYFVGAPPFGRWADFTEDRLRKDLVDACAALKIERHITPHGLRGAWATFARHLGVPKYVIMAILGQRTEVVLDRHYVRLGDPVSRAMMENVGRGFLVAAGASPEGSVTP
jgi:integrase